MRRIALWIVALTILPSASSLLSQTSTAEVRKIQQQYQKLIQDFNSQDSKIQTNREAFGEKNIEFTKELIGDLIGVIKDTPPSEDPGKSLSDYFEFLTKLKDLQDITLRTLNDIEEGDTNLVEIELRLQTLNQNLAKANSAVRNLAAISKFTGSRKIEDQEKQLVEKDWSDLDQAIEQMRIGDMALDVKPPAAPEAIKRAVPPPNSVSKSTTLKQCMAQSDACEHPCLGLVVHGYISELQAATRCVNRCDSEYQTCKLSIPQR
jgi:hypothetical protein